MHAPLYDNIEIFTITCIYVFIYFQGSQPLIKSGASGGVFILDVELLAGTLKDSYSYMHL
jgi:hypothetical protein